MQKNTGDLVWAVEDPRRTGQYGSFASVTVGGSGDGRYALFLGRGTLSAVGLATGNTAWTFPHGNTGHPVADPIVSGNRVFLQQNEECYLLELTAAGPDVVWRNASLCNGRIYCCNFAGDLICIDVGR